MRPHAKYWPISRSSLNLGSRSPIEADEGLCTGRVPLACSARCLRKRSAEARGCVAKSENDSDDWHGDFQTNKLAQADNWQSTCDSWVGTACKPWIVRRSQGKFVDRRILVKRMRKENAGRFSRPAFSIPIKLELLGLLFGDQFQIGVVP